MTLEKTQVITIQPTSQLEVLELSFPLTKGSADATKHCSCNRRERLMDPIHRPPVAASSGNAFGGVPEVEPAKPTPDGDG